MPDAYPDTAHYPSTSLISPSCAAKQPLRLAIISDIHGNLVALKAVASAIRKEKVDRVVCLGDVAAVGPQPHQTIAFLRRARWPCIMGNADESLAKWMRENYVLAGVPEEQRQKLLSHDRWTSSQLTVPDRVFLSRFKPTITMGHHGNTVLCYHGSPRSTTEGVAATMDDNQLGKLLGGYKATVFAGGHTHTQMVRKFGTSLVINPGSVGLPFVKDSAGRIRNPSWAEYALVTLLDQELKVELRRARYSFSGLERVVRRSDMPDPEWWLSDWY